MTTETRTELIDDLDEGPANETVSFSLDGNNYEIDLSDDNAAEMRGLLERYIDHGRRLRRGAPAAKPKSLGGYGSADLPLVTGRRNKIDREAISKFAIEKGLKPPSERGRLPGDLVLAWEEAGRPA